MPIVKTCKKKENWMSSGKASGKGFQISTASNHSKSLYNALFGGTAFIIEGLFYIMPASDEDRT
ncbi:hypothetical protein BCON_0028g00560 [Botryotinia convoluta]|uniref:Uncharacterized protein n=1 Tax=Botryotinia convoluta TaxID=54673 RepID=A0A4Z1II44_9HELO|nr:hypothetical protein BCON_0028g00560 [Botryotinia convoluta]